MWQCQNDTGMELTGAAVKLLSATTYVNIVIKSGNPCWLLT